MDSGRITLEPKLSRLMDLKFIKYIYVYVVIYHFPSNFLIVKHSFIILSHTRFLEILLKICLILHFLGSVC